MSYERLFIAKAKIESGGATQRLERYTEIPPGSWVGFLIGYQPRLTVSTVLRQIGRNRDEIPLSLSRTQCLSVSLPDTAARSAGFMFGGYKNGSSCWSCQALL
jgi:hypothetical protein